MTSVSSPLTHLNIHHLDALSSPHHNIYKFNPPKMELTKAKMNPKSTFIMAVLLIAASLSAAARPDSFEPLSSEQKHYKGSKASHQNNNRDGGGGNNGGIGGLFGPGPGFGIPGFEKGWGNGILGGGYGAGFGGPNGGYSKGGIIRPTVVCKEKGPCYNKKLICPAKCFTSFSRAGKGYGSGGGGGGCTMDCKKKCVAYC